MIIESIVFGLSSIVIGSLWFADRVLKRGYEDQLDPEIKNTKLKAFLDICINTSCPICKYRATKEKGLRQPEACTNKDKCGIKQEHLHVKCTACKSNWLMETADK
jgi:hypothetical protein